MLRQRDMLKYKTKSKIDHILFLRKDAEYLLRNNRPIKENLIPNLNDLKVHQFIEDILINKKISKLLFAKNSKFEIKTYLNIKKRFFTHKKTKRRAKTAEDNITTKMIKKETKLKLKNEINSYKKDKQVLRNSMDKINDKKIKKFKSELKLLKDEHNFDMKRYKINGFMRAYSTIKNKFDDIRNQNNNSLYKNRNKSCIFYNINNRYNDFRNKTTKNKYNKSLKKSIKSLSSETTETEGKLKILSNSLVNSSNMKQNHKKKNLNLPNVKLNIKDVFNRLYHNVVLLSPSSTLKNKKRPLSCKNNVGYSNLNENQINNNKITFHLKKVIKSTSGKEFTFKITKDIIQKCFIKYSGGPEVLKMKNYKNNKESEDININNVKYDENENNNINVNEELEEEISLGKKNENFVNYFQLIDKKSGNSFLHLAVIGGYDEFVRYFLEKKADINLKNYDGNTPLHLALMSKNKKIIDILMNNKPKLNISNNKGEIQFDLFTDEMKEYYGIDKLLIIKKNK